jgi:hypothetical protein
MNEICGNPTEPDYASLALNHITRSVPSSSTFTRIADNTSVLILRYMRILEIVYVVPAFEQYNEQWLWGKRTFGGEAVQTLEVAFRFSLMHQIQVPNHRCHLLLRLPRQPFGGHVHIT